MVSAIHIANTDFNIVCVIGSQVQIPLHPSNVVVTMLKLDKDRKTLLERKKRVSKQKNKVKEDLSGVN
jgi:hypothetical protein